MSARRIPIKVIERVIWFSNVLLHRSNSDILQPLDRIFEILSALGVYYLFRLPFIAP